MSEHPLDRIFRERLANQKAGPTEQLWAGIAKKQRNIRMRRKLTYLAYILAVLCLLVALYLIVRSNTSESPQQNPETTPVSTKTPVLAPLATIEEEEESTSLTGSNTTEGRTTNAQGPSTEHDANTEPEQPATSQIAGRVDDYREEDQLSYLQPTQATPVSLSRPSAAEENLREIAESAQALDEQIAKNNRREIHSHPTIDYDASKSTRSGLEIDALSIFLDESKESLSIQNTPSPSFRSNRPSHRFQLEASVGPAYANQILKASSEAFRPDLDAREVSEFPHLSYSAIARLRYRLPSGFSLVGGIGYTAIRNRLEYEMPRQGEESELVERTNAIRLIEIPVMLGYELPGEKVKLGISLGPVINLLSQAKGEYLSAETQLPVDFSEADIYQQNAGLAWRFNLSASYPIGEGGTRLLIEPTFSHYPRSFTSDSYPISERYWIAGIQLGIRKVLR